MNTIKEGLTLNKSGVFLFQGLNKLWKTFFLFLRVFKTASQLTIFLHKFHLVSIPWAGL